MMRALSKATAEKYALMAEMYAAGHTTGEIMAKFSASQQTVANAVKRSGLISRHARLSAAQLAERDEHIFAAYPLGRRERPEIAKTFGISLPRLSQIISLQARSQAGRDMIVAVERECTVGRVTRDPCFKCGVRGDYRDARGKIGCRHNRIAA
jgi:predicted PhzF superfamily epimerase YddE/YHI9